MGALQLLQWEIHSQSIKKTRMEAFIRYKERKSDPSVRYEATQSETEGEFIFGALKYNINKIQHRNWGFEHAGATNQYKGRTNESEV
jgi:hypothetical protein